MSVWVNFRNACESTRLKMKLRDPHGLKMAEDMEHMSGPVWVRRQDFPGCLDHLPADKPSKSGQFVQPVKRKNRAKFPHV